MLQDLLTLAALILALAAAPAHADERSGALEGKLFIGAANTDPFESAIGTYSATHAAIYLESNALASMRRTLPATPEMIDQRKHLLPFMLPIAAGSTVSFRNADSFKHLIFSISKVHKFNLGADWGATSRSQTFPATGIVKVYCDLHSQERAVILVVPNVFATVPSNDGTFRIEGIPAGDYDVAAFHDKFPKQVRKVRIPAGGVARCDFEMKP